MTQSGHRTWQLTATIVPVVGLISSRYGATAEEPCNAIPVDLQ
jgi:hypothetical protein